MQAEMVVASLEGVTTAAVDVEAGAARDEEAEPTPVLVVLALQPALPGTPLVDLVEDDQPFAAGPAGGAEVLPVLPVVPVEVEADGFGLENPPGDGGLPDLAWSGEEDHLAGEVLADEGLQVPFHGHGGIMREGKESHDFFCLRAEDAAPRPPLPGGP